ncbi:MAG: hypothetical protein R2788_26215 [Saprospiraceae bacterium]
MEGVLKRAAAATAVISLASFNNAATLFSGSKIGFNYHFHPKTKLHLPLQPQYLFFEKILLPDMPDTQPR